MIVTATPDLVLDVLQAADPVTQRAATAKLDASRPSDADFGVALDSQAGKAGRAVECKHSGTFRSLHAAKTGDQ